MVYKILAVISFLAVFTTPFVSSASSVTNTFLSSTTGNEQISVSDTIQFEVTVATNEDQNYNTIFWSITGDADAAVVTSIANWPSDVDHIVTDWEWHYTPAGGAKVKMGTNGRLTPFAPTQDVGNSVSSPYGFFATNKTGDGTPALVGTVTIHATAAGVYQGGGFQYPGVDGFIGSAGTDVTTVSGGAFTVVPEPGTALLMVLGLGGLGVMGRKSRK